MAGLPNSHPNLPATDNSPARSPVINPIDVRLYLSVCVLCAHLDGGFHIDSVCDAWQLHQRVERGPHFASQEARPGERAKLRPKSTPRELTVHDAAGLQLGWMDRLLQRTASLGTCPVIFRTGIRESQEKQKRHKSQSFQNHPWSGCMEQILPGGQMTILDLVRASRSGETKSQTCNIMA